MNNFILSSGCSICEALVIKTGNMQPEIEKGVTAKSAVFECWLRNHGLYGEADLGEIEVSTDDLFSDENDHFFTDSSDLRHLLLICAIPTTLRMRQFMPMLILRVERPSSNMLLLVALDHLEDLFCLGTYEALIVFGEVSDCLLLDGLHLKCLWVKSLLFELVLIFFVVGALPQPTDHPHISQTIIFCL